MDDQIVASIEDFGNVYVCPGGVIHINLAHMSLKFGPGDFAKFADLISQANGSLNAPRRRSGAKPQLQLVSDDHSEDTDEESED